MKNYQTIVSNLKATGVWQLICLPILVGFLIYLEPTILQLILSIPFPAPVEQIGSLPAALSMVVTVPTALFAIHHLTKLSPRQLGLSKETAVKDSLLGALGGFVLLATVVGLIVLLGGTVISPNSAPLSLSALLMGLVFFIFQGTWEEVIYRVYLMPHFSKQLGDTWSILLSSALFTLGHALNPGMQPLPILNLFVASIVFSLIYYRTGSLWLIGLGHGFWNFSQGFIFGAQVSGNSIDSSIFFSKAVSGKELISGGNFGFEGGLVTTTIALILIGIMVFPKQKNVTIHNK